MKILVVEDNKHLLEDIERSLRDSFEVETQSDGEEALYMIEQKIYDLIVLDIMLPGSNGITILRNMREKNIDTPVLILTAKETLDDKMEAFNTGANDYLTKPFYMEELKARIFAILKTKGKIENQKGIVFKDLELDTDERRLFIEGEEIELQNKLFKLLEYMLLNRGTILLKEQIYDRIWGIESDVTLEIVEVYMSYLRKKLAPFGYDKYIKTKRKVGYIFDEKK